MTENDLQSFLQKIEQLNQLVNLINTEPLKRTELAKCSNHNQVIQLTKKWGFNISKRWGETKVLRELKSNNILTSLCPEVGTKNNEILLKGIGFRLECIHLNAAHTPAEQWESSSESLWLLMIQGSMKVQIRDGRSQYDLSVGDNILINKGHCYRILRSDPSPGTIYLGLFWTPVD